MLPDEELQDLRRRFEVFAREAAGRSPLYAHLADAIAGHLAVTTILGEAPPAQRRPNLLFAAVHDRLLTGEPHDIARFHPSVGGIELGPERRDRDTAVAGFLDVLSGEHADQRGWPLRRPVAGTRTDGWTGAGSSGGVGGARRQRWAAAAPRPLPLHHRRLAERRPVVAGPHHDATARAPGLGTPVGVPSYRLPDRHRPGTPRCRRRGIRQGRPRRATPRRAATAPGRRAAVRPAQRRAGLSPLTARNDLAEHLDRFDRDRDLAVLWSAGRRTDTLLARAHPHGAWVEPLADQ